MTRREMQKRVLDAQTKVDIANGRLKSQVQSWKQHVNLPALLIGSFAAGAAASFLPVHRVTRTIAPLASIGFQTLRTFVWPMVFGALKNAIPTTQVSPPDAADTPTPTET
jgi:hypothetical protein